MQNPDPQSSLATDQMLLSIAIQNLDINGTTCVSGEYQDISAVDKEIDETLKSVRMKFSQ